MKRIIALAAALLVLATGSAFAQNKTSLNIICNVTGAQVYVNGVLAGYTTPNFSFLIPAGKVQVRVQKNGWQTFETVVQTNGRPITLRVDLMAFGVQPQQPPVVVQQPPVVVQPPQVFNYRATLEVSANVQGAQVFINGNQAGNTPFRAELAGGSYNVVIRAPGYNDYSQNIVVNGPMQINANLQPIIVASTWQLMVADSFVNRDLKGGHFSQIMLFIDGVQQQGNAGQFMPGRHSIRLVSGGMAVESFIDVQPGRAYTIQPTLGISIQ